MNQAERYNNLAMRLYTAGHYETACAYVTKAIKILEHPMFICNYATILTAMGIYDEAANVFAGLIEANGNNAIAWHNYGNLNMDTDHSLGAVNCYKECIRIDPDNRMYQFDLATALIQNGQLLAGLDMYEARRDLHSDRPSWEGIPNQKVLVIAEQGIGDVIQFSRYVPWLADISAHVVFALPAHLVGLFRKWNKAGLDIVPNTQIIEDSFTHQIPLMSLARIYYRSVGASVPAPVDNLSRVVLPLGHNPLVHNIGINWAAAPKGVHARPRSIPFTDMLELVNCGELYSLQIGPAAADIGKNAAQGVVKDLSGQIYDDLEITTGFIQQLDCVVTNDTSIAHLAATMGKRTYMVIGKRDRWRWGESGDRTEWYPSMTIVRCSEPNNWIREIRQVRDLLIAETAARTQAAA